MKRRSFFSRVVSAIALARTAPTPGPITLGTTPKVVDPGIVIHPINQEISWLHSGWVGYPITKTTHPEVLVLVEPPPPSSEDPDEQV